MDTAPRADATPAARRGDRSPARRVGAGPDAPGCPRPVPDHRPNPSSATPVVRAGRPGVGAAGRRRPGRTGGGAGTDGLPARCRGPSSARYVYLLVDPRTGRPFYVGRGRGDRCFRHVEAARAGPAAGGQDRSGHEVPALDRIREVEADGRRCGSTSCATASPPDEARLVEAGVDDALGLGRQTRLGSQPAAGRRARRRAGQAGQVQARATRSCCCGSGPHGADTAYERARHGWRIGRRWIDTDVAAVAPVGGRGGRRPGGRASTGSTGWEPSPATDAPSRVPAGGPSSGQPDAELGRPLRRAERRRLPGRRARRTRSPTSGAGRTG